MKAFLAGAVIVAFGAVATYAGLRSFDQSTAERYQDGSVVLLDHATSYRE